MKETDKVLSSRAIVRFIEDGFVCLEEAFPRSLAEETCRILWQDIPADAEEQAGWRQAVVHLGEYSQEVFSRIANTPLLHAAFDQLVGKGRWLPRKSLGSFPIRFPSVTTPEDTGWHVDASFPGEDSSDFFSWRININSRGRALLMLFLLSDVSEQDAPTRIRIGSHLDVARLLQSHGARGLSFMELAEKLEVTAQRPQTTAIGRAGTVYLCHPFLVHAAQPHLGTNPRFMAQPPLLPAEEFQRQGQEGNYTPVELAIRQGLGL
jgi:hypothetical protein